MNQLAHLAVPLGVTLTPVQMAQFERYRALLLQWNERINLTAITDPDAIVIRHFLDALSCVRATGDLNGQTLIDVGTGAGLPGVPLKIAYPDLHLTLVDSVGKKARFLEALVGELRLSQVQVVVGRAETIGRDPNHRARYDWAVARGVAHMQVLSEYLLPLVREHGHMLAMKRGDVAVELAAAAHALQQLGGGGPHVEMISLPGQSAPHALVCVEKIRPTPKQYPRRPGMPRKRPLTK